MQLHYADGRNRLSSAGHLSIHVRTVKAVPNYGGFRTCALRGRVITSEAPVVSENGTQLVKYDAVLQTVAAL